MLPLLFGKDVGSSILIPLFFLFMYLLSGLGCQMWGEEIMDNDKMYYQIFPRIAAYAECGWTLPGRKDYFSFLKPLEKLKIVWRTQGLMK